MQNKQFIMLSYVNLYNKTIWTKFQNFSIFIEYKNAFKYFLLALKTEALLSKSSFKVSSIFALPKNIIFDINFVKSNNLMRYN